MSYLNNMLVDGDTFMIDNSSLETFMQCPLKYFYSRVLRRRPATEKAALSFGSAIHLALKMRYYNGADPISEDVERRQMYLLEKYWAKHPTPLGDHRTLQLAQRLIAQYNMEYRQEQFRVVRSKGENVVEQPFSALLGVIDGIKVVWIGRIDLVVGYPDDSLFVFDHKTSSMSGEYLAQEYLLASQFKGYTWSLKTIRPEADVKGTIVNLLIARKPTKTGKGNEFLRVRLDYDEDSLKEWQESTLHIVSDLIHCLKGERFPMHTTQCVRKYGRCDYMDVDTLSPTARRLYLATNVYEDDDWTPLRKDEIDVKQILELPSEEVLKGVSVPVEQPLITSIDDLIKNIV